MFSKTTTPAALLSLAMLHHAQGKAPPSYNTTQNLTGFAPCDALIQADLSHAVHLPDSPLYPSLVLGSWSPDTQRAPWCFVVPSTPAEVSRSLTAIQSAGDGAGDWHVAIRSGGHGNRRANSLEQGVVIDLSRLNTITYDDATTVASVGPGARWGEVYASLQEHGVLVTGGREGVVGVGGLLLGGGVSWHTARTGFACDSVVNYELVLASGEIINANATAHSDLFRTLKGGGSNFGIVTRFDLETFPATNLIVDKRSIGMEHVDAVIDAVAAFTNLNLSYRDNALLSAITYRPDLGTSIISVTEINTLNRANSTAFDKMNRIPTVEPTKAVSQTLAQAANSSALSGSIRTAGAGPVTIANDPRVMRYCVNQYNSFVEDLKATLGAKNFSTILDFQPLPFFVTDISMQKGGNMLGLERSPRNKLLFAAGAILTTPSSQSQWPLIYQKAVALVQKIEAFAESVGSNEEFIYLAYADATQNPIRSYGAANVEKMKSAAKKYDPAGFFQRRVPGGFKLSRA